MGCAHAESQENQTGYKKNLPAGDRGRRAFAGALRGEAINQLGHSPENQKQRPPFRKEAPKSEFAAEILRQEDQPQHNQHHTGEDGPTPWSAVCHVGSGRLLSTRN